MARSGRASLADLDDVQAGIIETKPIVPRPRCGFWGAFDDGPVFLVGVPAGELLGDATRGLGRFRPENDAGNRPVEPVDGTDVRLRGVIGPQVASDLSFEVRATS